MRKPLWFKIAYGYAALLTAFTAMMVGMSIIQPQDFFGAYGINGDAAFQYSWSFRYMTILLVMCVGLAMRSETGAFFAILSRFFVDTFDVVGIFLYNTPEFSIGNMAFLLIGLLLPQIIFLRLLISDVFSAD